MKKKLLLETVLKLKSDIERSIENSYIDILKYNFTEKKVDLLLERIEKLEIQLVHFKEVIQEANKGKIGGVTNNWNIYTLSNLKAKKLFYEKLLKKFERKTSRLDKAQIKENTAQSEFKKLSVKIIEFEDKLSTFNAKKKVTVSIDESLNLL